MRDVYLNDIGDYVKYALLRELSGADVGTAGTGQLGVLWDLTVHEETTNDGCHRGYLDRPDFAPLDPALFSQMHSREQGVADGVLRHGVSLLEQGGPAEGYLPGARLHSLPLEKITGPAAKVRGLRHVAREEWWGSARRAVLGCPVVFLDPDNGVRPLGVDDGHRDEPKYCRRGEVVELIRKRCTELESGGRMIDAILTNTVLPRISQEFLTRMRDEAPVTGVRIAVEDGAFAYRFEG